MGTVQPSTPRAGSTRADRKASEVHPTLVAAAHGRDPVALQQALEARIAAGSSSRSEREYAHEQIAAWERPTAEYAYLRAAITGRLAELRGLGAPKLLGEIETYARRSIELDPEFQGGAATRLLGTLYVLAPARYLTRGDSETGLELLEELTRRHDDEVRNHLRLAEAYLALGDGASAKGPLCRCFASRSQLDAESLRLLDRLLEEAGGEAGLGCKGAVSP